MNVAADDVIQLPCLCRQNLRDAYNLWHFIVVSAAGPAITYADLATTLKAAVEPSYTQLLNVNAEFVGMTIKRMRPLPQSGAVNPGASNAAGLVTGDGMSRQTCGAVTKFNELAGPANRGRAYMPYPSETDNDADGNPTAGYKVRVKVVTDLLLKPMTVVSGTTTVIMLPIIYHKATGLFAPVTGSRVNDYWTTQKRRAKVRPS